MERQRRGMQVLGKAVGWIPLALALSAMSPVPGCYGSPQYLALQNLTFQQSMGWNPERAAQINAQVQLIQPYRTYWDYSPADGSRGSNEEFRFFTPVRVSL